MTTTLLDRAFQAHQAGNLAEAEGLYREVLNHVPDHPAALHLLGVLAHQCGHDEAAAELIGRAVEVDSRRIEAWLNLAVVLEKLGRWAEAAGALDRAVDVVPDHGLAWSRLGHARMRQGLMEEALAATARGLDLEPGSPQVLNLRGLVLEAARRSDEARGMFEAALTLAPDFAEAWNNLGNSLDSLGRIDDAIAASREALRLKPDLLAAMVNLGNRLSGRGGLAEADSWFSQALTQAPQTAAAHLGLGGVQLTLGRWRDALASMRRGLDLDPQQPVARSTYLFALLHDPDLTAADYLTQARLWNHVHAADLPALSARALDVGKPRLRIGYVSPDFKAHAAAYLLEALLAAHDRDRVEVYCYSDVVAGDTVTDRLKGLADTWTDVAHLSDRQLAERIREDAIDILVDCAGHTAGNRLLSFARKPAPVQVGTYFGHAGSTGLATMDWFLSDAVLTPDGAEDGFSERICRLPRCIAPFRPNPAWPEPAPLPPSCDAAFACVGSPARLGETMMAIFTGLLNDCPDARLVLKNPAYGDEAALRHWRERFSGLGDRVEFEAVAGGWDAHMDFYARPLILIDSFPVSGLTSNLIPLWMGVPVIAVMGKSPSQRFGASVLSVMGRSDLIAKDVDDAIAKAVALRRDRERLRGLRSGLRQSLANSPWRDEAGVTGDLETAFERMWRDACSAVR